MRNEIMKGEKALCAFGYFKILRTKTVFVWLLFLFSSLVLCVNTLDPLPSAPPSLSSNRGPGPLTRQVNTQLAA